MKTLITALAVTAMLAIPAVAKTERTRAAAHIQPNRVLSHNSVSRNPVAQFGSFCRFRDGETDPDSGFGSRSCATARNTKTATSDAGFCIGLTRTRNAAGRNLRPRPRCL